MTPPITLLSFNIDDIGDQFDEALQRLPPIEHAAVLRYKFEKDRRLALGGRLLRRYYYSKTLKVPWQNIEFYLQPDGKPALADPLQKTDFNISHDGNWVIFGATEETGMLIGVDVVDVNHDTYGPVNDFISSYNDQLMDKERQLLGSIKNEHHRLTTFYQIWGLKESYIKAIGKGLALALDQFCILPLNHSCWSLSRDTKAIQLGLYGKEGEGTSRWCIHLDYLDSQTISVVCCGSKMGDPLLDKELVQFGQTTMNLGDMYNGKPSIFTRMDLKTLLS
ncbi:4'-phosphopantetheinyl transferase superfamily, partial [Chlamydoabsidia padenii]